MDILLEMFFYSLKIAAYVHLVLKYWSVTLKEVIVCDLPPVKLSQCFPRLLVSLWCSQCDLLPTTGKTTTPISDSMGKFFLA